MRELTVIVPIYNVEKYLERCVNSIVNQTYKPEKIILVDDGSTDKSGALADEFAAKHENVTVIHKPNGGLSSARNAGLEMTDTEFVTFVDSDDYLSCDMYEKLFLQLENCDADISIGGVWYEQENGKKSTPYKPGMSKVFTKIEALKELNSYRYFNMGVWNKIYKTSLFEKNAYGDEYIEFPAGKVSEDFYVMHKIIARADKIAYTSEPLYHYIQRPNSISRNKKINTESLNAALAQVDFYNEWFSDIAYIAESMCVFTFIGVYAKHIKMGLKCPEDIVCKARKISQKYMKSVLKNDVISLKKKLQAAVFGYMFPMYKYVAKIM